MFTVATHAYSDCVSNITETKKKSMRIPGCTGLFGEAAGAAKDRGGREP